MLPLRTESNVFKAGLAAAGVAVAALVAGMGLAIKATFKWADELDSIQDIMGVTNVTAAALNFTLRKSGTSTEALTKGMTILSKGLIKADGSLDVTGKSLKAWGIDVLDANGMLKDQTTLIGDISDKYASFSTQQEKVNFLTETFGRSGAELIDFFDTLANDGGIDAVAAKVERLGLAIDPNRYEQFNRNLEELKLVGLGMAVAFTEKVMPVVEKFLEIISNPALTVSGIVKTVDDFIGGLIDNMATSIDTWVTGGGPEELSNKIISWVENLGDGEGSQSKILAGAQKLVAAITTALGDVDWIGITDTIDAKIAEMISSHDWTASGDSFGDAIEGILTTGAQQGAEASNSPAITAIGQAISDWFTGAVGQANIDAFTQFFPTAFGAANAQAADWAATSGAIFSTWATGVNTTVDTWAAGVNTKYKTWANGVNTTVNTWASNTATTITTAMTTLNTSIDTKLREASKTFFNVTSGWGAQAEKGFNAGKNLLLSAIQGIVTEVNRILKQIITSFTISIGLPSWLGGGDGSMGNHPTGGGGGGGGGGNKKKAAGGSVFGGQTYMVGEMGPELFVPDSNGRITPNNQLGQTVTATIDEGRLARTIVTALMQAGYSG